MPISNLWKKPPTFDPENGKFINVLDKIWVTLSRINVFLLIVWIIIAIIMIVSVKRAAKAAQQNQNGSPNPNGE